MLIPISKPLKDTTPINAPAWLVFGLLAAFNSIAAIYSPILDCDEVFNYWEPSHYLNHGHGFETWEYSPEFAIRSWAYAGIHALLTLPGRLIPGTSRASEFYTLRILLGMLCAFCQTYAYLKVARIMSPKIGQYFVLVCLTSPGFFFASVSYLPSSSAAYMTLMAVAEFIDWRGGAHTAEGITWFGVASVVAWPFAGILIVPFIAEDILVASITDTIMDAGQLWIYGITRTALAGVLVFFVDLAMYRKYVCVAFNIVWYNILARTVGKGPNIFGVEPWHYYFRNLILNFHVWFVLAVLALPAIYYQQRVVHKACNRLSYIRNLTIATPLYLWLAIFSLQPHKEERFMYPAYPLIAINAAQTIHLALMWLGNAKKSNVAPSVSAKTRLAFVGACLIGALAWSGLRIAGIVNAYGAPLSIYKPLHGPVQTTPGDTVCLGKEWYRFPSHYHLPAGVKAKFIKSDFDGLLPGEFSQASTGFGLFPGAWLIPPGMNDRNIEDPGKHVSVSPCLRMFADFIG